MRKTKMTKKPLSGGEKINPSYDKSLSVEERLRDFLGAYHIVLHGVKAHEPFSLKNEGKPDEMCDTEDKNRLIKFVEKLIYDKN